MVVALVAFGCSQNDDSLQTPTTDQGVLKSALDGTETLGDPSIFIAQGTGMVGAGVGLRDEGTGQPGTINIDVPAGATVLQVLLYWEGHNPTAAGDPAITVDGNPVTGTLIGGPTYFFTDAYSSTYRADITSLGLISAGSNSVEIDNMDYEKNNGAGMLVIYDDGGDTAEIGVKDGNDLAYYAFAPPLDTTVPQTINFSAASMDRQATIVTFASSVQENRPNVVYVTIGGATIPVVDPFSSGEGRDFDEVTATVTVPAGATSITIQGVSEKHPTSLLDGDPASFAWLAVAVAIIPEREGDEGCTPGYWKQDHHACYWLDTGYGPNDDFDTVFGTDYFNPDITLLAALKQGGGGYKALGRHAVAALLSAAHPDVNYGLTEAEVIAAVQAGDKDTLEMYNEMGCPLNNCKDYDYPDNVLQD
jgi:hypothetical protein